MAYSCGYHESPDVSLEDAQRAKLSLVCRKLGLEPGTTLLDVGCGWGSLSLHAAEHFGAKVTGVTIAAEQKRFIDARIAERGLADRVEIRLQDYREVPESEWGSYDAVSSIEMGEHVGERNYPTYVEVLRRSVKPGRPGAGAADVAHRPAAGRRAVHRVVHRARHAHAAGRRDRRAPRARGARGARRARAARALRAHRRGLAGALRGATWTGSPTSSARRSSGSGGSTSSAARWPSATAGWASTRS